MSDHPADFRVEIIQARPQGVYSFFLDPAVGGLGLASDESPPAPIDITSRCSREGFGSINRAMERDLLTFKTGDLTLSLRNHDGYFDDLFDPIVFGPQTAWSLRVYRRGEVQFWGVLIGKGSIIFDRKQKLVEVTVYGLTKILDLSNGENVQRSLLTAGYSLNGAHPAGSTTLTLATGANDFITGDTVHITDNENAEDVTVKQVLSATQVSLEAATANAFTTGDAVSIATPYHRFQTIEFLVRSLFEDAAGIPLADLRISDSQFDRLGPTAINLGGLSLTTDARLGIAERNGRYYATVPAVGTYYQENPDDEWTLEDATARGWIDWSRYYRQDETPPTIILRNPQSGDSDSENVQTQGWDYKSATKAEWYITSVVNGALRRDTTTDGTTWLGDTLISAIPEGAVVALLRCVEFDPGRGTQGIVVCSYHAALAMRFRYWDVAGAAWVDMKPAADPADTGYFGPTYVPELDAVLVLKATGVDVTPPIPAPPSGDFTICAFRGTTKLWERDFPSVRIAYDTNAAATDTSAHITWPTRSIRFVDGSLYCVAVSDGAVQLIRTDDEFQTYVMSELCPATSDTFVLAGRILGSYYISCYRGTIPRHFIAAPFHAGVVEYADFSGMSVGEALKKLAVISNALFWVDDDLQGHFVARDLFDPGTVTDIEDRIKERNDTLLWDETAQYVTVSGGGVEVTSGDAGFASEGIDLDSDLVPNEAFAQALADSYLDFYSAQRQYSETVLHDKDGTIFRPLDRVTPDGASRFLVYESDHSLIDDEVSVTLLEDR